MRHPVCTHTHTRPERHARGSLSERRGVSRSLHAARAIPPYSSLLSPVLLLAFRYCILVPPVYIRSLPQALAAHLLLLPQTAGSPHRPRERETERRGLRGRETPLYITGHVKRPSLASRRAIHEESSLVRALFCMEGSKAHFPLLAASCTGCTILRIYGGDAVGKISLFFILLWIKLSYTSM